MKLSDTFTVKQIIDEIGYGIPYLFAELDNEDLFNLIDHPNRETRANVATYIDIVSLKLMEDDSYWRVRDIVKSRLEKETILLYKDFTIETNFAYNMENVTKFADAVHPGDSAYAYAQSSITKYIKEHFDQSIIAQMVTPQLQFPWVGQATATYVPMIAAVATGTCIGPSWTFVAGAGGGITVKPVDQIPVEKIQAKVAGPLSCSSCNQINEYAEPNQKDGTYICYNCK